MIVLGQVDPECETKFGVPLKAGQRWRRKPIQMKSIAGACYPRIDYRDAWQRAVRHFEADPFRLGLSTSKWVQWGEWMASAISPKLIRRRRPQWSFISDVP